MEGPLPCHICDANSGLRRISPAPTVWEGTHWMLEHAYPTSLRGWLVVVLKRHCEKLHELSRAEWAELADLQYRATRSLHSLLGTDREYTCCFAEMEGFKHLHFHVIPKAQDADPESVGTKAFHHLKVGLADAVPPPEVVAFCADLRAALASVSD